MLLLCYYCAAACGTAVVIAADFDIVVAVVGVADVCLDAALAPAAASTTDFYRY